MLFHSIFQIENYKLRQQKDDGEGLLDYSKKRAAMDLGAYISEHYPFELDPVRTSNDDFDPFTNPSSLVKYTFPCQVYRLDLFVVKQDQWTAFRRKVKHLVWKDELTGEVIHMVDLLKELEVNIPNLTKQKEKV